MTTYAVINFVEYDGGANDDRNFHEVSPVTFASKEEAEAHDPFEWFLDRSQAVDHSQRFEVREVAPKAASFKDEHGQVHHSTYFDIV
jgi:hypothetical protein